MDFITQISDWESSKKEYTCYDGERDKFLSHLFRGKFPDCIHDPFVQQQLKKGIDVTGLVEIKYIGDTEEQAAFLLPPNVETETQEEMWQDILIIISRNKSDEFIKDILQRQFIITRKQ